MCIRFFYKCMEYHSPQLILGIDEMGVKCYVSPTRFIPAMGGCNVSRDMICNALRTMDKGIK